MGVVRRWLYVLVILIVLLDLSLGRSFPLPALLCMHGLNVLFHLVFPCAEAAAFALLRRLPRAVAPCNCAEVLDLLVGVHVGVVASKVGLSAEAQVVAFGVRAFELAGSKDVASDSLGFGVGSWGALLSVTFRLVNGC